MSAPDYDGLFAGVGERLDGLLGRFGDPGGARPASAYQAYFQGFGGPFAGLAGTGGAPTGTAVGYADLWGGPFAGQQVGATGYQQPFARQASGADIFGGGIIGETNAGRFFAAQNEIVQQKKEEAKAKIKSKAAIESGGAGDWSGPATADDNATLDATKVEGFIRAKNGSSPLIGKGQFILDTAQKYGVSAPLLLAIFWKESSLGSTAGPTFNIAGVGGAGNFTPYSSWEQAIEGAAANLATPTYKGKSVDEQIGSWYAGPERYRRWGRAATDAGDGSAPSPNGSVGDYVDKFVAPTYAALGVPVNPGATGTRKAAVVSPDGAYFPVVGWTQPVQLHWGSAEGTGATDVMAPAGSQVVAIRGGQVTYAAYDPTGGWAVMVQGDDGLQYYYAHFQAAPSVQAGQRIGAGTGLGRVGNTGNASTGPAHLHIGIGPRIRTGTGPLGGTGENADGTPFDAVSYLNRILSSRTSGRGGGTSPKRV